MSVARIVGGIGRLLVALGVVILLFVAYLLWGTALSESGHQAALRQQFDAALRQVQATSRAAPAASSAPAPAGLVDTLVAGEAPPAGEPVAVLQIPKLGLTKVVVQGTATDNLERGPGHYAGTPMPGQPGNAAIAGHRTTYGAPFADLNELARGDRIEVTTLQGHFDYTVFRSFVVAPTDTAVLDPTSTPELTLTTCTPRFSAAQRLVVQAGLGTTPAVGPTAPPRPTGDDGLGSGGDNWMGPLAWGADVMAVGAVTVFGAHRLRRRRALVYAAGALPVLGLLFLFFQAVTPLLPQSY